jgi:hypothetical protein
MAERCSSITISMRSWSAERMAARVFCSLVAGFRRTHPPERKVAGSNPAGRAEKSLQVRACDPDPPVGLSPGFQRSRWLSTTGLVERRGRCLLAQTDPVADLPRNSRRDPPPGVGRAKPRPSSDPRKCSPSPNPQRAGRRLTPALPWRHDPSETAISARRKRTPHTQSETRWRMRRCPSTDRSAISAVPAVTSGPLIALGASRSLVHGA